MSVRHLLIEAGMIVFSVLLALSLESWRERHGQRELARHALQNIRVELTENRSRIETGLLRHRALVDSIRTALNHLEAGEQPRIEMPLYPTILSRSAWTSASTTGAMAHMDLQTVEALARFYDAEGWISRIEDSWTRVLTSPEPDAKAARQRLISLQYLALSYIEIEQSLAEAAEAGIQAIPAR